MKNYLTLLLIAVAVWACAGAEASALPAVATPASFSSFLLSPEASPFRILLLVYLLCGWIVCFLLTLQLFLNRHDPRQQASIQEIFDSGKRLPAVVFHPLLFLAVLGLILYHLLLWPMVLTADGFFSVKEKHHD